MARDLQEIRPLNQAASGDAPARPPLWFGFGAVLLAVLTLAASFFLVGEDREGGGTTTTASVSVLPALLVSGPDGVRSGVTGNMLIDDCAVKAIADRLGGIVAELCDGEGLVHLTASGNRRQLVFDPFYRLDAHYEQPPQPGVVVIALGDPGLGDTTATFVYLTGSETHFSVILPSYTDLDQRNQLVSSVGIGATGDPDDGCLRVEAPGLAYQQGCGSETSTITMSALHPFEDRVAFVERVPAGTTFISVVDLTTGVAGTRFAFEETPIELDFTDDWLAIAFEIDGGVVTRVLQIDTYYFEDIDGLAMFQHGPITL